MSSNSYDDIAKILKEAVKRYPDDAFDNTRRLKGLLADHLSGVNNEINIVISAIEEGIPDQLKTTGSQGIDVAVNRLTEKLETAKGIRGDIAKSAVLAFSYALGMSDLPSSTVETLSRTSQQQGDMPSFEKSVIKTGSNSDDDWVGVSEVVQDNSNRNSDKNSGTGMLNDIIEKVKKRPVILAAVVVVIGGFMYFDSEPTLQVRPLPQPQQPQQPAQPTPQQPQQPAQPTPQQPQQPQSQNLFFSDDQGNVWKNSPQNASKGIGAFTTQINGQTLLMKTQPSGQNSFNLTISGRNGQKIYSGQASQKDSTHFNYAFQGNGQSFQGVWHVNHMPSR